MGTIDAMMGLTALALIIMVSSIPLLRYAQATQMSAELNMYSLDAFGALERYYWDSYATTRCYTSPPSPTTAGLVANHDLNAKYSQASWLNSSMASYSFENSAVTGVPTAMVITLNVHASSRVQHISGRHVYRKDLPATIIGLRKPIMINMDYQHTEQGTLCENIL